jgi:O-antigen/teichoic acid export membrane protein
MKRRGTPADGPSEGRLAVNNGSWGALQQGAAMGANSVIGLLLVVALPVDQFGAYSYATALSAVGVAVMSGGLASLGVKMLLDPARVDRTTMTGLLVVREVLALVSVGLIVLIGLTSTDDVSAAAALLAASSLIARAFDAPELWYRAQMQTKVIAWRRLVVTVLFFGARLVAIFFFQDLWLFLILFVAEAVVSSGAIFVKYLADRSAPGFGRVSVSSSMGLVRESWPLLISGIANQANLRSDVIVIQAVLGASAVGVYSAAARMSELAFFIPVVFMNATLPLLLKTRRVEGADSQAYRSALQKSYDGAFWLGVVVAAAAGGVGTFVITTFFRDAYAPSVGILWILVIACPFVFMAAVYSKWIIAEGILWASVVRHSMGAVANIGLNLALLPVIGIRAAAISTVTSYIVASYLSCFLGRRSRLAGIQMTLAIVAPARYLIDLTRQGRSPRR